MITLKDRFTIFQVCLKAPLRYVIVQDKRGKIFGRQCKTVSWSALCTDDQCRALATKESLRQNSDSVRNLRPNSHNVTAATTHVYTPINQNMTYFVSAVY